MDSHYLNNAVYLMEEFLENTEDPHYARAASSCTATGTATAGTETQT